jgi:hypothetical protein
MADYFTHFSCVLDVGTPDNAARALDLYPAFMKEAAREGALAGGFRVSIHPDQGGTKLWMRDEVTGDPLQVIIFVQRCAEAFGPHGPLGLPMGQHLLPTTDQCIQRRRTRTRSRHPQARSMDPHKPLAGPRSSARPRNARCAMSTPDHARANFRMLLRAAADGNLASESTNDTDLLAQGVADLGPARSHVLLRLDESSVRAEIAEVIAADETLTCLTADAVTDADIHVACCAVVEQTDLWEERGAAVFRAALAAIREAERQRAASVR